jgi:hypothetical protein
MSTDNLTKALSEASSHEEIAALLHAQPAPERAPRSTTIEKELAAANSHAEIDAILHEGAGHQRAPRKTDEPATFTRTEKVGGKDIEFSADSALELERAVTSARKVADALQTPVPVEVDYAKAGRDAALRAAEQQELERRFKRNEITTQEYLEQSGAVETYLENQGVPIDELRETVEEKRNQQFTQSWTDATATFLASTSDWVGGEKNKQILGLKIQELGLLDAPDKVGAISQAFAAMKKDQLIFANDEPTTDKARTRGSDGRYARSAAPSYLDHATPQEILEAYKNGRDPQTVNSEFSTLFGRH